MADYRPAMPTYGSLWAFYGWLYIPTEQSTSPMKSWIDRGYLKTYGTYVGIYLFPDASGFVVLSVFASDRTESKSFFSS